jgi:ribonucleoside-diphosphate reductase alpha chain
MTTRQRLANRRQAETFNVQCAGLSYVCTIGRFPDGRIAEIFLQNHKSNSTADVNARDASVACSFALQFGAGIEDIRKALCRDSSGRASGPLGVALDIVASDDGGSP